jgi:uncharacterized protein
LDPRAAALITALDLVRHPEGGYFRETHRSRLSVVPRDGRPERSALTTIVFLLPAGELSRWHRVVSDEAWHFLEGDPLQLYEMDGGFRRVVATTLGPYGVGSTPAHVVAGGSWQAARSAGAYTLVGCTVGPGFDFADFEMLRDRPAEAEALALAHPELAAFV